jgi:AcrR family transcriptional regulator
VRMTSQADTDESWPRDPPQRGANPGYASSVQASESEERAKPPAELGPLPGGHHGLSREQVAESQRERLIAALAQVTAERGYKATTITEIVKVASVSTRAFYEHFEGKEEIFLAAFEAVLDHLEELLAAAVEPVPDWPHRVIAALRAALSFFDAEPDLARLVLVEPITATSTIAVRFREAVVSAIPYLQPGRAEHPDGDSLPESTEDSLVGGLVVLTSRAVLAAEPLSALLSDLVEFVFSPYLGPEAAKQLARDAGAAPA